MSIRTLFTLLILAPLALLIGCASEPSTRDLHDMETVAISTEVIWEGTVVVDKIIIVTKGGHLIVKPGTKVLFKKVDWDGDKIGDAEITVEGRLTAVGTKEAPILFASSEENPGPSDWKYLHVNFAKGAEVEYVRVSNAFSAIQVHYSKATIKNSDFRHNVDGIRFSTADLTATGNWSMQNRHGVRYEERGHPATVTGNAITDNAVGIFAVTMSQGESTFEENDLGGNDTAVKMGWEQSGDLAFPNNWWGDEPLFMDKEIDETLGKVTIQEPLTENPGIKRPFPVPANDADWARATKDDLK